jgi:hypothetical protein
VASNYPEKVAIIAGKKDKAQIIMDYAISHIFDNELTKSRFIVGAGETLDYIRRHRNKQHLTFDVGDGQLGELFIGSAKDASGFGAVAEYSKKLAVAPASIAGDDIGIGKGVADRITELLGVYPGVNVGSFSEEKERFLNLRAELFWKAGD